MIDSKTAEQRSGSNAGPVAVIDIGTTMIRMAIADIGPGGAVCTLENLSQAVSLGKDTFTRGVIEKSTTEDCVRVLKSYRRLLEEYGVTESSQMRVVATSAVREAANRLAFLDRIYSATGIDVEPLDEAEVTRITYLGVQPFLNSEPSLAEANVLLTEVGGGSTELLVVQQGEVVYSHTYRLGSLRLRETLAAYRAPKGRMRQIMENQIDRTVDEIRGHLPSAETLQMVALGGDVRFAASQLLAEWDADDLSRVPVHDLERLTDKVLRLSEDDLVQKYHLTFPDAETLGPALLAYLRLGRALQLDSLLVTKFTLRDGLLKEMVGHGQWSEEFRRQILRSAIELGRKFQFEEAHCRHVATLAQQLFRALAEEHRLDDRYELLLTVAALLYEIGLFVSNRSYHKHSMYLILNSELFGLGKNDLLLIALTARYHRRASPKPQHEQYATLGRDDRIAVAKMAAMLRVADALDRSHSGRIQEIRCSRENGDLLITVPHVEDLSLEQLALQQKGTLFEETFGMQVRLRQARGETTV